MEAVVSQRPWRRGVGRAEGTARACRVGGPGHPSSMRGACEGGKAVPENKWIVSDRVAESIREPQM